MSQMDDFLRKKLFDHASELPQDMWQKIEAGISEDKRRKGFLFYFLLGSLLVITSGTYAYYKMANIPTKPFATETNFIDDNNNAIQEKQPLALSSHQKDISTNSNISELNTQEPKIALTHISDSRHEQIESKPKIEDEIEILADVLNTPNLATNEKSVLDDSFGATAKTRGQFSNLILDLDSYLKLPEREFKDPIGCPTFSSNRSIPNIFIEGYAGLMLAQKQMKVKGAETSQDYLDLRRSTESPLISWMAGINVGWISPYNIGLKGGFNYESINERFRYEDSIAVRNQTVITIDTLFNPDGSISSINSDTSVQQVFGYETQSVYNYHKTINIPIELIYQFDLGNLDIELSGGPVFNIRYVNRGKIVDPSNDDRWFTNGANDSYKVFKDNFSLALTFSASALYSVNDRFQVFARPSFKYTLNTLSTSSSPFDQRYLNYGVSVGARYYISKNPGY